jgi:hypothetical protein
MAAAAAAATSPRNYTDFVPPHQLVEEAGKKVLQINLSAAGKSIIPSHLFAYEPQQN